MDWLKNPWVWGGGAVALLALWYLSSGSSGSSGTASYAQSNLDLVASQAQINGQIEQAQIAANTTNTANIASAIANLVSANYGYKLGAAQIAAGVQTTQIGADTAKYVEDDQVKMFKANQVTQRYLGNLNVSQNESIAGTQARTAEDIAGMQAATVQQAQSLGFINNFLKGIGL